MKRLALAALFCTALAQPALADPLAGYEAVDLSEFKPREAASAVMLLQDLFEGHPETVAEGRSVLKIDLKHNDDRSALLVDLEMSGYLDDSVDGEKYRAIVVEGKHKDGIFDKCRKDRNPDGKTVTSSPTLKIPLATRPAYPL